MRSWTSPTPTPTADGIPDITESAVADPDGDCIPDQFDSDNAVASTELAAVKDKLCPRVGVCGVGFDAVAVSCPEGSSVPVCDYSQVAGWEADEVTCDGLDNDCDGVADEGAPDADNDGTPDCQDDDADNDGIADADDNCVSVRNSDQADADGDSAGDACDVPGAVVIETVAPTSPANDNAPVVSGTGEPYATVDFFGDSACSEALGGGVIDANGTFSATLTVVDDKATALYAQTTNRAGLSSTCAGTFVVYVEDSTPPEAPGALALAPAGPSDDPAPQAVGSGEPDATAVVYNDAACAGEIGRATVSADGAFAVTLAVTPNATTTVYVLIQDAAANASACVAVGDYVHDDNAPPPPSASATTTALFTAPQGGAPKVELDGCAEAGSVVTVYSDDACGTVLASAVAGEDAGECSDGASAWRVNVDLIDGGATDLYVAATDAAGNAGDCTPLGTVEHDGVAPPAPVLSHATATAWDGQAPSYTFEVVGSAEADTLARFYTDAACTTAANAPTATAADDGRFTTTTTVGSSDPISIYATATDAAGNVSACSRGVALLGTLTIIAQLDTGTAQDEAPVLINAPDGAILEQAVTDSSGIYTTSIFAGCSATVATDVQAARATYRSAFDLVPGQTARFIQPSSVSAQVWNQTYTFEAQQYPVDTYELRFRTGCGMRRLYNVDTVERFATVSSSQWSSCVSSPFSLIVVAVDIDGNTLAYGTAEGIDFPPQPLAGPSLGVTNFFASVSQWRTDFGTYSVELINDGPTAAGGELSVDILQGDHRLFGHHTQDRADVLALPDSTTTVSDRFGVVPGMTSNWRLEIENAAADNRIGLRILNVLGDSVPLIASVALGEDLLAPMYRFDYDEATRTFDWSNGLGALGEVIEAEVTFRDWTVQPSLLLEWRLAARPERGNTLTLPVLPTDFPLAGLLDTAVNVNIDRGRRFQNPALPTYEAVVEANASDFLSWWFQQDSGETAAVECCQQSGYSDY